MLKNVYVAGGMRTPFGNMSGALANLTAAQLGTIAVKAALEKAGVDPKEVDEVAIGNVVQAGHGQNLARQVSLAAGIPDSTPAITINKVCGSAMRSVIYAAQVIQCGDGGLLVAGGTESMTNAPYFLKNARAGYRMGNGDLIDGMINDGLWDVYSNRHMGTWGDDCAKKYEISREDQDNFAIESYQRAIKAWDEGFFEGEIAPVEIKTRRDTITVERDEEISKFRGPEKLRDLRPAFAKDGLVTAGNASGISDGAAAMIVFGDEKKDALNLKPTARILGYANAATEPGWFTVAPIQALRKLSDRVGIKLSDVDLFEINEAFSVVTMVAMRELKLDHAKVNVAGGAVSVGHPIGASGARVINTLVRALERSHKKIGMAAICLGGGEADAIAIELCS